MEIFGALERLAAQIYPYRWLVAIIFALLVIGGGWLAYRFAWHRYLWQRKLATVMVALPLLAIAIPLGYYLLSPLWTRTHLEEESPLAVAAGAMPAQVTVTLEAASTLPTSTVAPTSTPTSTPTPPIAETATPASLEPTEAVGEPTTEPDPTSTPEPESEPTAEPEPEPTEFVPHIVLAGEFHGADDFHFGSGTALLIATAEDEFVLRFEDFSVRNGPDLFVYFSTNPDGWSEDGLNLGELRATDGSFNYDVPAGVDISKYRSVVIWCRAFAVLFATATFQDV